MKKFKVIMCETGPFRPMTVIGCVYNLVKDLGPGEFIDVEYGVDLKGKPVDKQHFSTALNKIGNKIGRKYSSISIDHSTVKIFRLPS